MEEEKEKEKVVRGCTEKEDVEEDDAKIFDCILCNQPPLSATVRRYFKCKHIMCKHCFAKYEKVECPACKPQAPKQK